MNTEDARLKRLQWHSRRGMLELDLLLVPYAEACLRSMAEDDLADYEALLLAEDQDLFLWLTGRAEAPHDSLRGQVARIRRFKESAGPDI